MTIRQIQYAYTVAKLLSFSEAAEKLYISQSNLSKQIISLEKELSVTLFDRRNRKIALTEAGSIFVAYAEGILDQHQKLNTALTNCRRNRSVARILVCSIPVALFYRISDMIGDFLEVEKDIQVVLTEKDCYDALIELDEKKVDLAIVPNYVLSHEKYTVYPLFTDELVLFMNRLNPLACCDSIVLSGLKEETFLFLSQQTSIYKIAMDACLNAGFLPKGISYGLRIQTLKSYINKNIGISLLMKKVALSIQDENTRVVPLSPTPVFTFSAVMNGKTMTKEVESFLTFARRYFELAEEEGERPIPPDSGVQPFLGTD